MSAENRQWLHTPVCLGAKKKKTTNKHENLKNKERKQEALPTKKFSFLAFTPRDIIKGCYLQWQSLILDNCFPYFNSTADLWMYGQWFLFLAHSSLHNSKSFIKANFFELCWYRFRHMEAEKSCNFCLGCFILACLNYAGTTVHSTTTIFRHRYVHPPAEFKKEKSENPSNKANFELNKQINTGEIYIWFPWDFN